MSIRYGVALIPEPSFTARFYRARQILCGQYASWAAEMHMVHLALTDFFQCPDSGAESLSAGLDRIAGEIHHRVQRFPLLHRGVSTFPDVMGGIYLDFTVSANPVVRSQRELNVLHHGVIELLEQTEGVVLDLASTSEDFHPHINLMEYANLPAAVFNTAVEFARAVLRDLQVPHETRAWQLALLRFQSESAGDNWDNGAWAPDLRWQLLATYPL
jgi:2'-5' RNA ligase